MDVLLGVPSSLQVMIMMLQLMNMVSLDFLWICALPFLSLQNVRIYYCYLNIAPIHSKYIGPNPDLTCKCILYNIYLV